MSNQKRRDALRMPGKALLRCRMCGIYSSRNVQPKASGGLQSARRATCSVVDGGCGQYAVHDILTDVVSQPVKWRVRCPDCEYETLVWEEPNHAGPHCPECSPEGSVSDMVFVAGVSGQKAARFADAGIESIEDLRERTQQELLQVDGIGKALAARIKADVGWPDNPREIDNYDPPKLITDRVWWHIEATDD